MTNGNSLNLNRYFCLPTTWAHTTTTPAYTHRQANGHEIALVWQDSRAQRMSRAFGSAVLWGNGTLPPWLIHTPPAALPNGGAVGGQALSELKSAALLGLGDRARDPWWLSQIHFRGRTVELRAGEPTELKHEGATRLLAKKLDAVHPVYRLTIKWNS